MGTDKKWVAVICCDKKRVADWFGSRNAALVWCHKLLYIPDLSCVADDFCLGLNEAGVADGQTVEEVHEDDDDEEDEAEEEYVRNWT